MLVLISNLICSNNVRATLKIFTQLIVSSFQIKLPKSYGKHPSSSCVINFELREGMLTSFGVTLKSATPRFPQHKVIR